MKCADLDDRLFDEDCRAALLGRAPAPTDVAAHLESCATCQDAWQQAAGEAQELSRRLVVAPPRRVRSALLRAFRPAPPLRVHWRDTDRWAWVVGGGALGAAVASSLMTSSGHAAWTGCGVGLALGLAAATLRGARLSLRAWGTTSGAMRRLALRLAQGI
jgi:hypothetical protein